MTNMPKPSPQPSACSPRIFLLQPPFVQLNAPYPAPYYLQTFLAEKSLGTRVADHSIGLFSRIFCRQGLTTVFAAARPLIEARLSQVATTGQGPKPDRVSAVEEAQTRFNLSRYLSRSKDWIATIDRVVEFLRCGDPEFGHLLSAANGALPSGARVERFLASVDGSPSPNEARELATLMLADLADLIRVVLDPGFSLVRYAENLAASVHSFAEMEPAVDGWILRTFYEPLLQEEWDRVERDSAPSKEKPFILACTLPFPGCLAGALAAARSAKARFGNKVRTIAGGGYVNTELRSISSLRFFDYFDYLCFDRGYGAFQAVLEAEGFLATQTCLSDNHQSGDQKSLDQEPVDSGGCRLLYKTIFRDPETGTLMDGSKTETCAEAIGPATMERYASIDAEAPSRIFPDYRSVDFSRYILPLDDVNPMHRLWSDGRWLKVYLAHGCYWHACAFCDVKLDYISGYLPVDPDALFAHLLAQAEATGVRGVHLVDEAAPVSSLLRLAQLNREAGLPLVFWGNIRFERDFTPDRAAALAAGGLLGVSAGIEVATERGFKRVGKGIGLKEVVRACAAFKEAGILVHAYLIFGYWDEDDQEIIDSIETVRQLFAAGLVDSAFWHKFVLTRHSRIYAEWEKGRHPQLELVDPVGEMDFADNDLRFRGEERHERWSAPLDALAALWMSGDQIDEGFGEGADGSVDGVVGIENVAPFETPLPRVAPNTVEVLLEAYARDRDSALDKLPALRPAPPQPAPLPVPSPATRESWLFLGGEPIAETVMDRKGRPHTRLCWNYRLESHELEVEGKAGALDQKEGLNRAGAIKAAIYSTHPPEALSGLMDKLTLAKAWPILRRGGLVSID